MFKFFSFSHFLNLILTAFFCVSDLRVVRKFALSGPLIDNHVCIYMGEAESIHPDELLRSPTIPGIGQVRLFLLEYVLIRVTFRLLICHGYWLHSPCYWAIAFLWIFWVLRLGICISSWRTFFPTNLEVEGFWQRLVSCNVLFLSVLVSRSIQFFFLVNCCLIHT